jgi:hypothetical protein
MKKILFVLCFSVFNTTFSNNITKHSIEVIQERSAKATIYVRGEWHYGYINYQQYPDGYVLTSYRFQTIELPGQGQFSGVFPNNQFKFIALNPNNEYAKNYNFTHYVDIMGLRAYITG